MPAAGAHLRVLAFVNGEALVDGDTLEVHYDLRRDTHEVVIRLRAENYHPRPLTLQEVTHQWARST